MDATAWDRVVCVPGVDNIKSQALFPSCNQCGGHPVLLNTIPSVDVLSCDGAEVFRCCSPFGRFLGCSLGDTSHYLRYCYFLLSFTLRTTHILQFPFAISEHYCLFILTCFTTWDQKLSSGSLPFQTSKKEVYLLSGELHRKVATYTLLHSV